MATGEPKSYTYLLQRLLVAIQVGNAAIKCDGNALS